ncbi:MAG: ATP-binding protein [Pirellulaceae bacterium]
MNIDVKASLGWQVFEESNDAIFLTSEDNLVREVNPFAQRLTGYARSELISRSLIDLVKSCGQQSMSDVISALNQTGIFHSREEFQLKRRGLDDLPVNLSISRIHTDEEILCVVIARDISERVKSERRLQEAHDALEHRVAERTAELQVAHDELVKEVAQRQLAQTELQEANQELAAAVKQQNVAQERAISMEQLRIAGLLASGMAHDISNSITPIVSLSDLLARETTLTDSQRGYVDLIRRSAADIASTVKRLREVKPLSSELQRRVIDLPDLLQGVVDLSRPRWFDDAKRRGASINARVTVREPTTVYADESALRAVLTNLVFNAADAIDQSGEIELQCDQADGHAMIVVSDNGKGMSDEQLATCFEPFVTWRENGCGLGLSMCQRIIEQHHGQIDLSSTPGAGTFVRLLIPMTTPENLEVKERRSLPTSTRFLVVDDDLNVRISTQALLISKGMKVDIVVNATEAIERLQQSDYDIVISDLGLPGMDGRQLLQECRRRWPNIRTVLVSGWMNDVDGLSKDGSADISLEKPFTMDDLFERLASLTG